MIKLKKNSLSDVEVFSYEDKELALLESIDNNMYLDIVVDDICQISKDKIIAFMNLIHRKMRHGCNISVSGIETKLLFEKFNIEDIDSDDLNKIIYQSKSLTTSREIRQIFNALQIKIESININNINFTVKGKRV